MWSKTLDPFGYLTATKREWSSGETYWRLCSIVKRLIFCTFLAGSTFYSSTQMACVKMSREGNLSSEGVVSYHAWQLHDGHRAPRSHCIWPWNGVAHSQLCCTKLSSFVPNGAEFRVVEIGKPIPRQRLLLFCCTVNTDPWQVPYRLSSIWDWF